MTTLVTTLRDDVARRAALTDRRHGLLVEAGAGSGKTAILAGRVALLVADGVPPREIAAITFTELAAAELAARVRRYVEELAEGQVPGNLAVAFPTGAPSPQQRRALLAARDHLDELTCSTIHGFARELVRPYPVEANIDPGASVLDATEQALLFDEVFEGWLRERLGERPSQASSAPEGDEACDVVAELVTLENGLKLDDLEQLARLVLERQPEPHEAAALEPAAARVAQLADAFLRLVGGTPGAAEVVGERTEQLRALAELCRQVRTDHPSALALLAYERAAPLFTQAGALRALRVKGAWVKACVAAGLGKPEAEGRFEAAMEAYQGLAEALDELTMAACDLLLAALVSELADVGRRYRERKRDAAALDFDDLIATALELLRERPDVRDELAERYRYVLIDEFQDTDPQQAEIVWRLTGEPNGDDWRTWRTRPGARFVVGDPKQSIYRFRGADAATYRQLSESMAADPGAKRLELTTNFRSYEGILEAANATFAAPLSLEGQPGYRPLDPFHASDGSVPVRRLLVAAPEGANAEQRREAEAACVANLVLELVEGTSGLLPHAVSPGDIALLAPVGSELEVYERALDARGLNVASQAGKGFYRRQEVQDLVALTRALADPRDRLALGALLRGPLVGATDEELLDAAEALKDQEGDARHLNVLTDPELLPPGVVRATLERLRPIVDDRFATTPHALLSRALAALEVRAVLEHRHGAHADRALANLDRFLERSRAYAVRGLGAFAADVWASWEAAEAELEGRVDSESDAVTLITIHSAKGLEWKVVIPVNGASTPKAVSDPLYDREARRVVSKLLGHECSGYAAVKEREEAELLAERVRLWYVAATRARELFVVPQHTPEVKEGAWCRMVEWRPDDAPVIEPDGVQRPPRRHEAPQDVAQSREAFLAEQERIRRGQARIERRAPSRRDDEAPTPAPDDAAGEEATAVVTLTEEAATALLAALDEEELAPDHAPPALAVGAARGVLLHKLLEELIDGEHPAELGALAARAAELISQLHHEEGYLDPAEVAECALRAWTLPEVAALHGRLLAEVEVAGVEPGADGATEHWSGVADAIAVSPDGKPEVVIDWKSDRDPSPATLAHYREQLRAYLRLTGAPEGLLVLATLGRVERVA